MSESRQLARMFLVGVGDASLGEWEEQGQRGVFHLRRRLSADEQQRFGIPEVRDVRGTGEYGDRLAVLLREAPHLAWGVGL